MVYWIFFFFGLSNDLIRFDQQQKKKLEVKPKKNVLTKNHGLIYI